MKVNIDFWRLKRVAEEKIIKAMDDCLDIAKKELESRTPEDTGKLVKWYKKKAPKKIWNIIYWKIINKTTYWIYVEFWVKNKKYNYHKPKGSVFYRGIGARMLTKTKDYKMSEFKKLFLVKIWQWKR